MDSPFSPCNSSTPHFHQSFFPNNNNLYKQQQNNNNSNNHGDGGVARPRKKSSSSSSGKSAKLSTDRQSVAARERRHRISDRFKILQSLVPGGSKMDTVSMLEGAIDYVNFLKAQIWLHETMINSMAGPNDVVDNGLLIRNIDCPYYYDASNDYSQILGDEWLQDNNAGVAPPYPPSQLAFVEGGAPVQGEETMYCDEFVYY